MLLKKIGGIDALTNFEVIINNNSNQTNNTYFIVHALGNNSTEYWYPFLKFEIEKMGSKCFTPNMPVLEQSSYETWEKEFDKLRAFINETSVVVGHSTGSIFLVHYLLKHNIKVSKFIGVVSFNRPNHNGQHEDWDKINQSFFVENLSKFKSIAKERICFYSPTDIYNFNYLDEFATEIDAQKVIIESGGHFTAASGYGDKFIEIVQYI